MLRVREIETEDGEEEYHQLPPHEAVSEDQGTDQAGQMKRKGQKRHREKAPKLYTHTMFPNIWGSSRRGGC